MSPAVRSAGSSKADFGKNKFGFMAYSMDPVRRKGGISLAVKEMREERSRFSSLT